MDDNLISILVDFALFVMVMLLPITFYQVAKNSKNPADQLIGVDMITNLLVGIVILLAILENTTSTIDIGIVIAALSFTGTVSIARFISEGRVF